MSGLHLYNDKNNNQKTDNQNNFSGVHTLHFAGEPLNWAELKLPAKAENVAVSRAFVAGLIAAKGEPAWDVTVGALDEIKVAVSEAVSNAIIHAYARDESQTVRILAELYPRALLVQVQDSGIGIADIARARCPDFTTGEGHLGLGFAFMESFMDEVQVESAPGVGTTVWLVKYFPLAEAARAVRD